jgi:hypothetical protein
VVLAFPPLRSQALGLFGGGADTSKMGEREKLSKEGCSLRTPLGWLRREGDASWVPPGTDLSNPSPPTRLAVTSRDGRESLDEYAKLKIELMRGLAKSLETSAESQFVMQSGARAFKYAVQYTTYKGRSYAGTWYFIEGLNSRKYFVSALVEPREKAALAPLLENCVKTLAPDS